VERRKRNRLKLSPLYHSSPQNTIVRRHFYVLHNLKASSLYNYPKRTSPPENPAGRRNFIALRAKLTLQAESRSAQRPS
jgi:hypothetical protein